MVGLDSAHKNYSYEDQNYHNIWLVNDCLWLMVDDYLWLMVRKYLSGWWLTYPCEKMMESKSVGMMTFPTEWKK